MTINNEISTIIELLRNAENNVIQFEQDNNVNIRENNLEFYNNYNYIIHKLLHLIYNEDYSIEIEDEIFKNEIPSEIIANKLCSKQISTN